MKQGNGIIVVIVLILVIAVVSIAGYAYLETDVFKTPEQKFVKYLAGNYERISNFSLYPFDEVLKRSETETSKFDVTYKQKIEGISLVEGMSSDTELLYKVSTITDPVAKKQQTNVVGSVSNVEIFDMEMFLTDTRVALRIPDIHNKYIALDTNNIHAFVENIGVEEQYVSNIPNELNLFGTTTNINEEQQKLLKSVGLKYGTRILELIDDEIYIEEKKVPLKIEDEDLQTNKYSLTLTLEQIASMYTTITTEMFADTEVESALKIYLPDVNFAELKELNEKVITNLNTLDKKAQFTIAVYENDGITRKTEFITNNGSFDFYIINDSLGSKIVLTLVANKTELLPVGNTQIITIKNEVQNQTSNLTVETVSRYDQNDISILKKEAENNGESEFYDEKYYASMYKDTTSKMLIRSTKTDNDTVKSSYTVSGSAAKELGNMDVSFIIKLNDKLKFSDVSDSNTIVVNDYKASDYVMLGFQMLANMAETAKNKPQSLVGGIYSLFSALGEGFVQEQPSNVNTEELNQVETEIKKALENILLAYRFASKNSTTENIADYLTVDNIKSKCSDELTVEFYDGQTLKCTINGNVYYVSFNINGSTFMLENIEAKYSTDGTFDRTEATVETPSSTDEDSSLFGDIFSGLSSYSSF